MTQEIEKDPRAMGPIKGKVRRLLDQCEDTIHIIAMASNLSSHMVGLYVTRGPDLVLLNNDLLNLGIIEKGDLTAERDYFPEVVIAKVRTGLKIQLGNHSINFQTHAAVLCPTSAKEQSQGQE